MARKLKKKVAHAAPKPAPAIDEDALIERNAAFSAVLNEWGAALLQPRSTMSDARATSAGDFAGQLWNLASGPESVEDIVATLVRPGARSPGGESAADAIRTEALVRSLVAARRDRFGAETRQVEAVLLQHLGGKRFYLALPVGWDAELI